MSNPNPAPHIDRELDLSNTGRGVWLVKVPKYIANKWDKAPGNIEVGKLKISRVPGQRAQVQLSLSEAVLCLKDPGEQNIPKEHRLDVSNETRQSLGVFSHVVRKYLKYRSGIWRLKVQLQIVTYFCFQHPIQIQLFLNQRSFIWKGG